MFFHIGFVFKRELATRSIAMEMGRFLSLEWAVRRAAILLATKPKTFWINLNPLLQLVSSHYTQELTIARVYCLFTFEILPFELHCLFCDNWNAFAHHLWKCKPYRMCPCEYNGNAFVFCCVDNQETVLNSHPLGSPCGTRTWMLHPSFDAICYVESSLLSLQTPSGRQKNTVKKFGENLLLRVANKIVNCFTKACLMLFQKITLSLHIGTVQWKCSR